METKASGSNPSSWCSLKEPLAAELSGMSHRLRLAVPVSAWRWQAPPAGGGLGGASVVCSPRQSTRGFECLHKETASSPSGHGSADPTCSGATSRSQKFIWNSELSQGQLPVRFCHAPARGPTLSLTSLFQLEQHLPPRAGRTRKADPTQQACSIAPGTG